jgi:hypothetical protein
MEPIRLNVLNNRILYTNVRTSKINKKIFYMFNLKENL